MRPELVRKSLREGGRLAKRPPIVQQRGPSFPGLWGPPGTAKSRWIPAASRICPNRALARSEPLAAAVVGPAVAVVTVAVEAALAGAAVAVETAVHHPMAPAETAVHTGEHRKAGLLALIEGLVGRVGGIGDLLHRGGGGRHGVGALAQASHGIGRRGVGR